MAAAAKSSAQLASEAGDWEKLNRELDAWLKEDPAAALSFIESCAEPQRSPLRLSAFANLGRYPQLALSEWRKLRLQGSLEAALLQPVLEASLLREGAFAEALQAARENTGPRRSGQLSQLCASWVTREPSRALELAALLESEAPAPELLRSFHEGWAQGDPRGLVHYAASLPAGPLRSEALETGLQAWLLQDPVEATAAGLRSAISDTDYDAVLHAYLTRGDELNRDSAQALQLVREIATPALREEALAHVLHEWAARDRGAARDYVLGNTLTQPELRQRLLAAVDPVPPPSLD